MLRANGIVIALLLNSCAVGVIDDWDAGDAGNHVASDARGAPYASDTGVHDASAHTDTGTATDVARDSGTRADSGSGAPDVAVAGAMQVTAISGNGQVVIAAWPGVEPMVVQVTDEHGMPVSGVTVDWSMTPVLGNLHPQDTVTDANGMVGCTWNASPWASAESNAPSTVTASIATGAMATFSITATNPGPYGEPPTAPTIEITTPDPPIALGSGRAGSVMVGAIRAVVANAQGAEEGSPIPNVGLEILNASDPTLPAPAQCLHAVGGAVLTDATGFVTCDLQLGTTVGATAVTVRVGASTMWTMSLTITP